jgi:hypothetical protein
MVDFRLWLLGSWEYAKPYRLEGLSIEDIADFLGIAHSQALLAVRQGENQTGDPLFAKVLIALPRNYEISGSEKADAFCGTIDPRKH